MIPAEKLKRYKEIRSIVKKYGFGIFLERRKFKRPLKIPLRIENYDSIPLRLRSMMEELGPAFIKMGQMLSRRPDIIPFKFIEEFEKLKDEAEPLDGKEIKEVIRKVSGKDLEDLFLYFEEKPIYSCLIYQKHKAKLKNGKEVVVKVKRPEIEKTISTDIQTLYDIARFIEESLKQEIYQPLRIVEEFEKSIKREFDLRMELRNMEKFSRNFEDGDLYIPDVFKEFTNENILVYGYFEGIKIDEIEKTGLSRKEIAEKLADITLKQIFTDGFFHCNPANIIILPDGKISYLDFGIAEEICEERKRKIISLLDGFLETDPDKILKNIEIKEEKDKDAIKREISEIFYEDGRIGKIIEEIYERIRKFKVKIPADFSIVAKTLIDLEKTGLIIDPEFNLEKKIRPFIEESKISYLIDGFKRGISNIYLFLKRAPRTFNTIFEYFKKGYSNFVFLDKRLENLTSTINKSTNRISFALVVSALLVSSSLIIISGKGPLIMGLPAFGIFTFLISVILGICFIIGIIRGGKL